MKQLLILLLLSSCSMKIWQPLPLYTHTWVIEVTYLDNRTDTIIQHRVLPNPQVELDFPTKKNEDRCIYFNVTHCENQLACNVDTFNLLEYKTNLIQ